MSSGLPPPYYASVASLQAQHRDVATLLRVLSQDIVRTDSDFHQVYTLLEGKEAVALSKSTLKDEWNAIRKVFHDIIWSARRTATEVEVRNGDFVEALVPLVGDPDVPKEDKIEELQNFVKQKPPKFLTSSEVSVQLKEIEDGMNKISKPYNEDADRIIAGAHQEIAKLEAERDAASKQKPNPEFSKPKKGGYSLWGSSKEPGPEPEVSSSEPVDYDTKIALAKSMIEAVNAQRGSVLSKITDIRHALATIPDQVGTCFSAVWSHLTTDATHLRNRLEGSTRDPLPDFNLIERTYTEIKSALQYYATNVNKMSA